MLLVALDIAFAQEVAEIVPGRQFVRAKAVLTVLPIVEEGNVAYTVARATVVDVVWHRPSEVPGMRLFQSNVPE